MLIVVIGVVVSNGMFGLVGWLLWDILEEFVYFECKVVGVVLFIGWVMYELMDMVLEDLFIVSWQSDFILWKGCYCVDLVEVGLGLVVVIGKLVFVIGGVFIYVVVWLYCYCFYLICIEMLFVGDMWFLDEILLNIWDVFGEMCEIYCEWNIGCKVLCWFIEYQ